MPLDRLYFIVYHNGTKIKTQGHKMTPTIQRLYKLIAEAAMAQDWPRCATIARLITIHTKRYALANKD